MISETADSERWRFVPLGDLDEPAPILGINDTIEIEKAIRTAGVLTHFDGFLPDGLWVFRSYTSGRAGSIDRRERSAQETSS